MFELTTTSIVLQIFFAILYSNLIEWVLHKYVLHHVGKEKKSFFSFHWHAHHRLSRKNNFVDPEYKKWWFQTSPRRREVYSLTILVISQFYIGIFFPIFYLVCVFWGALYYFMHAASHKHPNWGKKWMRHHYDHHMGKDQDLNWCVTFPIWDYLLKTRKKYHYDKNGKVL